MSFKIIPKTYQEDSADTRKENPQLKYEKMYHEDYVKGLVQQIDSLHKCVLRSINGATLHDTRRTGIPLIKKGKQTVKDHK